MHSTKKYIIVIILTIFLTSIATIKIATDVVSEAHSELNEDEIIICITKEQYKERQKCYN